MTAPLDPQPSRKRCELQPAAESPAPAAGLPRRAMAAALVVGPMLWLGARAQAVPARTLTPSQTEGPFYPVKLPKDHDHDLLRNGRLDYRGGQATWLDGRVTDAAGKPLAGAQVEIWQCDENGH